MRVLRVWCGGGVVRRCADESDGRVIEYSWSLGGVTVDPAIADPSIDQRITLTSAAVRSVGESMAMHGD